MLATGVSQLFGGLVLMSAAWAMGGSLPRMNMSSIPVFSAICVASIISYCVWFEIVQTGQLSHLFIIKFSTPIFASLVGAVLLGENILRWQYLLAFVLITLGILCSHKVTKRHDESTAKAAK